MSEKQLEFSIATIQDRDTIMALYRACGTLPGCTWSDEYPTDIIFDEDISTGRLFCLRESGIIIGAVSIGKIDELSDARIPWKEKAERHCELARIGILPELTGHGLGKLLLNHAIEVAKCGGFESIRIIVSPENEAALALYDRVGFQTVSEADMFGRHWYCQELLLKQD